VLLQVTRKELEDLKSAGITHLRVPIGYWILGEPYLKPDVSHSHTGTRCFIIGVANPRARFRW
jgi:aryl-phospho-beta-D-glucosidase BglC (GH1 family)